jgi:hypothetical protein
MIRAWHFLSNDKLRDGTTAPPDGEWLEYSGPLVICESGLHASLHPFDALQYAPGNTLCLVDCDGPIIYRSDKLVCSRRRIVVRMDAEPLLRYFACQQALSVIHLWTPPLCVLDYLMGDDVARAAAWTAAAAEAAAWDARATAWAARTADAARAAAWAAAWAAAARAAAWAGAGSTARAAEAAARAATRAATRAAAAASNNFTTLVNDAFEDWI